MKYPNKKLNKVLGRKVSPGQQIIQSTKPSAVNSHTKQMAANADAAYRQQQDMAQMRKATKQFDQRARIFDELDPKNNSPQRSNKLGY